MKFMHILSELYCKPCYILPAMHQKICQIVDAHINGAAHTTDDAVMFYEESRSKDESYAVVDGDIAVIPICGVIGKHVSHIMKSSGVTDVDDIAQMVKQAVNDDLIKGIFLDVNSPGGAVTGVPETADVIAAANTIKPVLAFTDQLMASAATFLTAGADFIYSTLSARVGSIGTYMAFLDVSRHYEMEGWMVELFKAGRFKGMGIPGTSLTDEHKAFLQQRVDTVNGWFKGHVLTYRNVEESAMEGQDFNGQEGLEVGLVDAVGSANDALAELRAMINNRAR